MKSKIVVLDEITANQIAAGEVIERPSSVIKELVENSLDAGADHISIYIEDGGKKSIKIIDNGTGINKEDALLAFQRHATSKIHKIKDLEVLSTLGFRGEALASIASVAKIELISKTKEDLTGTRLLIEGGTLLNQEEVGSPVGTTIKVEDLFFNTPARKKHLKGLQRELASISDLINKLSLATPSVAFSLTHNRKKILSFPGGLDLSKRIFDVYGVNTARELISIKAKNNLFEMNGFIGKSNVSRASRSQQAIFINNRFIKSKLISKAIEQGYHTYLMVNRHPIFAVHLNLNHNLVDVNVHPTKMEIKFDKEKELEEFIWDAVKLTLGQKNFLRPQKVRTQTKEKAENEPSNNERLILREKEPHPILESACNLLTEKDTETTFPDLIPIGQIDAKYIVCQGEDGMYLIDQHAAHERILYEKLMAKEESKSFSQQMLIPVPIDLKGGYTQLLIENIITFSNLGFIIEHFGGDTFIIRGIPQELSNENPKELFLDLLDDLSSDDRISSSTRIREKIIISMSCQGAIKAGKRLQAEEVLSLIEELSKQDNPYTCPHGRPTISHFTSYELDKEFRRIV